MVTLTRRATAVQERDGATGMSKRLPRPANPVRARCELDDAELRLVERMAVEVRLSVASFIRVALIESAAHPERVAEWSSIATRLAEEAGDDRPKPGRPKKGKK